MNFASNCYQHLQQAIAAGFIWSIPSNVSRFENLTGCKVREIDLNPNSQVPGFYPNAAPQVTRSEFVGFASYGGENLSGNAFVLGGGSIYDVSLTKPSGMQVCSLRESARVFESPVNGKTYVLGRTSGSHLGHTTDLAVGWGPAANEIETVANVEQVVNGVTSSWYSASQGQLEVQFEDLPSVMPLGSTYEIRIKKVYLDYEEVAPQDLEIRSDAGLLAGLTREADQAGFAAIYTLRANEYERGISELEFSFALLGNESIGSVSKEIRVGVDSCFGPPSDWSMEDPLSNLYRIIETDPIQVQGEPISIEEGFQESVGWTQNRWFALDPTEFPNQ
jgi:hypothetical protein